MGLMNTLSTKRGKILLVDAGNTRIKLAVLSLGESFKNLNILPSLPYGANTEQWKIALESGDVLPYAMNPLPVLCSSVVDEEKNRQIQSQISDFFKAAVVWRYWKNNPLPKDFSSSYESPGLGSDRLLAALAARRSWPEEKIMVLASFGTATTVDTVFQHRYCGGLIAPGIALMAQSLASHTANLAVQEGEMVAVPNNTADAIHTAIIAAQLGCIEHALRAAHKLNQNPSDAITLIVSGGGLAAIARHLPAHEVLPNAVLQGLAVIASETDIFSASL